MTAPLPAKIWDQLGAAATSRSPFNFLQLATVGLDSAPQLRTIVLRRCDAIGGTLSFVTDKRSPKIREIRNDPRVALVGFDPTGSVQLRLSGEAEISDDEAERLEVWQSLRERTLILFDAPHAPGTILDDNGQPLQAGEPLNEEPYKRFALVTVRLNQLEWLDLSAEHHVRCAFDRDGATWRGARLAP